MAGAAASAAHFVRGDASGLQIPTDAATLAVGGAAFLTDALHSFGTLARDNRVTRIGHMQPCIGGSTGSKLFVTLEYARPEPGLDHEVFVKFSRDFKDSLRDRGRHEMESEVRFAELSRQANFPIAIPRPYFADYHADSQSGILVTEVIRFGAGAIAPQFEKCMDHTIADPLACYRVVLSALARVAAAHKSGRLGGEVERLFPFCREAAIAADRISWSAAELAERIARYADFVEACRRLFPEEVRAPDFWTRLKAEAPRFLEHQQAIKRFLHKDDDYIALCHWNANIDNGWFWRDGAGALHCGLMDWGRVRQLNLAFALWGCLNGAPLWVWSDRLDELLDHFVDELQRHGGPRLDRNRLRLYMDLYVATMGLAFLIEAPMRILRYLPEAPAMTGPLDPRLLACERARNQRHISSLFLWLWHRHDFSASLDAILEQNM